MFNFTSLDMPKLFTSEIAHGSCYRSPLRLQLVAIFEYVEFLEHLSRNWRYLIVFGH